MERPPKQHEELKRHGEKAPPTGLDRPPPSIDELPAWEKWEGLPPPTMKTLAWAYVPCPLEAAVAQTSSVHVLTPQ